MNQHAVFWVVGMIVGGALGAATGQSFVHEHGKRLIPLFIVLSLAGGLVVGWALNAWIDFAHATATMRGS